MLNGHVSMEVVSGNTDTPKITEMYYVSFGTGEKKRSYCRDCRMG
jgi:hypothetical protein